MFQNHVVNACFWCENNKRCYYIPNKSSILLSLTKAKICTFLPKASVMTLPVVIIIISLGLVLLLICMLIVAIDSGRKAIHNYIAAIKLMVHIKHLYGDVWDTSCDNEATITASWVWIMWQWLQWIKLKIFLCICTCISFPILPSHSKGYNDLYLPVYITLVFLSKNRRTKLFSILQCPKTVILCKTRLITPNTRIDQLYKHAPDVTENQWQILNTCRLHKLHTAWILHYTSNRMDTSNTHTSLFHTYTCICSVWVHLTGFVFSVFHTLAMTSTQRSPCDRFLSLVNHCSGVVLKSHRFLSILMLFAVCYWPLQKSLLYETPRMWNTNDTNPSVFVVPDTETMNTHTAKLPCFSLYKASLGETPILFTI